MRARHTPDYSKQLLQSMNFVARHYQRALGEDPTSWDHFIKPVAAEIQETIDMRLDHIISLSPVPRDVLSCMIALRIMINNVTTASVKVDAAWEGQIQ